MLRFCFVQHTIATIAEKGFSANVEGDKAWAPELRASEYLFLFRMNKSSNIHSFEGFFHWNQLEKGPVG